MLIAALRDSTSTAVSCRRGGGAMLTRIGSWGVGIACRQLETVCSIVEGAVKLLRVNTSVSGRGTVLGCRKDQHLCGNLQGLG